MKSLYESVAAILWISEYSKFFSVGSI